MPEKRAAMKKWNSFVVSLLKKGQSCQPTRRTQLYYGDHDSRGSNFN